LLGMGRKKKISQLLKKIGSGKDFKPSWRIIPVLETGGLMARVNKPVFRWDCFIIEKAPLIAFYYNGDFLDSWYFILYPHNFNFHLNLFICSFQKLIGIYTTKLPVQAFKKNYWIYICKHSTFPNNKK
jgi:hypothetical protein